MTLEELLKKKAAILKIAKARGASNVRIFGSVARGESAPGSDIDILVDLERERSLLDLGGLLMELQELLECNVDVVTEDILDDEARTNILKEAVNL